jgi:drug/metabolite transporter (DMT)-like permease
MKQALLKMHLAVFLWGFTGILGRAIELEAFPLVWYRVLLSSLFFLILLLARREKLRVSGKELLKFALIGSVIAVHWCCFYGAIKYANASIALVCLATAGIFTSILEPFFLKNKFNIKEMLIGLVALIGMYFIYRFEIKYAVGIGMGILAAVLSSLFTIMNKKIVDGYSPRLVAFYEIFFGFLFLSLLIPVYTRYFPAVSFTPNTMDWLWLVVLSLFCTVWGQALALEALKKLSSFTTVLMVNLEPVYGIILAIIFYHENDELGWGFVMGMLLIAGSVAIHSIQMLPEDNKLRKRLNLKRLFIRQ